MTKRRKTYRPEDKVTILKRHFIDKIPISDLCDQYGLSPAMFYSWQKQFFENGASAFVSKRNSKENRQERRIQELEQKLAAKNEVVSELMEAHIKLKKILGQFERCLGSA